MALFIGCVRRAHFVFVLLVGALLAGPVAAQDIAGALQGTVVSPDGKPEPEVRISVSGNYLQGSRETTTDRNGFFQFLALPPGRYALKLSRVGLRPLELHEVVVELGRTASVGVLTVTPQPIQMAPVVVDRAPMKLDPVHTTAGGNLSAKDYDALPVDRDYKSLISVLPMVNKSYRGDPVNVGGSTGLENQFYIDGVNVTDTRNGSRATSLPSNFVRAVDVKSGGYEAQYGRALGAVVNAVTFSGTNDFESSVFGVAQPVALSMTPRAAPAIAEAGAISYDFGARLSGPVVRDRLWFSAAANPRIDRVEKNILGHGFFPDRTSAMRFASKLTWRPSPATNVEASVFGDPTVEDQVSAVGAGVTSVTNPDALLTRVESGGTTASLRSTWAPSRSFLIQTTAARQWDRFSTGSRTPGGASPGYFDAVTGTVEGGVGFQAREAKGRTTLATRGTLMLERHTLISGAEYEDSRVAASMELRGANRDGTASWTGYHEAYSGTFHNRSPAGYLQDTWRVTDRLAFNAGLRWSGQYLTGASGRTAQRFADEWQPRGGFSWQPGRLAEQRVFGSYGRYYQTIPTNIAVMNFVDYLAVYSSYSTDPRQPGATPDNVSDYTTYEVDFAKQISGLHTENFDEYTLGYERLLGSETRLTLRGMRRDLRSSYQWGMDTSQNPAFVIGTPGKGNLSYLPPPKRQYTALEVSAEGSWRRMRYRASYVLSRTWGNYPGLYNSDFNSANPGQVTTFFSPNQAVNSTGYLPNDRTHVLKFSPAMDTRFGLMTGAFVTFESGAPINDFAAAPFGSGPSFLAPRGSAGRSPALWNVDVRLTYELPLTHGPRAHLQADVLHIGNLRRAVQVNEWHYLTPDMNAPNPNYKHPLAYQPPMAGRIGLQVGF